MNPAFWQGKRVLLTGHTGFKGSWLALWLQRLGAEVSGLALAPPTRPSLFETARVAEGIRHFTADIRDFEQVRMVYAESRPEIVFHLAAQALVRHSYAEPLETYATNVLGTAHVLEAARHAPDLRAIVSVTSDKCYDNREWPWGYRENDPLGGHDPYSSSKGCAELVSAAYRDSFLAPRGIALATARAGNVIGGGDWAEDRLIPDILRAIEAGHPVNIRSPEAIRPWQHVLEPLAGYLLLAERLYDDGPAHALAWNFGPADADARPVRWIVEQLTRAWGEGAAWQLDAAPQPHEAHYLKLDCSKARQQLGWQPRWDLSRALRATLEWHKDALAGVDPRALCLRQITEYSESETP